MASTHNHAPWRKAILVPFWTIQLLIQLLLIGLLSLAIGFLVRYENDSQISSSDTYTYNQATKIIAPIWLTVIIICLALTITEIVLLAKHNLKPLTFLLLSIVKSTIWTVLFILDVISVVNRSVSRTATAFSIFFEAVLLLSYLIPLLYGSIIYHRLRTNSKSYSAVSQPFNPTHDTEYSGAFKSTPYNPPESRPQGFITQEHQQPEQFPPRFKALVQDEPIVTRTGERRLSYNHQRDTRFEAFRNSYAGDLANGGGANGNNFGVGAGAGSGGGYGMMGSGSPPPPEILIHHHDGEVFEMAPSGRRVSR